MIHTPEKSTAIFEAFLELIGSEAARGWKDGAWANDLTDSIVFKCPHDSEAGEICQVARIYFPNESEEIYEFYYIEEDRNFEKNFNTVEELAEFVKTQLLENLL